MARKLRLEYGGACYHVINRGNYRRDLFSGKGSAESFQTCLFEAGEKFRWRVHAYVIMRNHFHLAVETPEPNLSEGMRWLQATWAARFNRYRGESGRPFQGRYKALHVEPGQALAQVAHYIHLNPVRAKAVTIEQLLGFKWSSLPVFAAKNRPGLLEPATILGESGGLPDTAAGWRRYVDYLGVVAEEEMALREKRFGRLSRGWAVGSPGFKAELRKDLLQGAADRERFELLGSDAESHREVRTALWEEKLMLTAKLLKVSLNQLPSAKSAQEKVWLAAVMKARTSVSNGWLAERLKMGKPASVSQFVRRFVLNGGLEETEIQRALSKVNP
jgi:putative transposase